MTRAETTRRRELLERARALLPELSTSSVYRITALLERALAETEVPEDTYLELERALARRRGGAARRGL